MTYTIKKAAILSLFLNPFLGHAADRFVDGAGGTDSGDCNGAPCQTVTYALSQSVAGDDIYIETGTYIESPNISIAVNLIENTAPVNIGNVTLNANITNVGVEAQIVTVTTNGIIQDGINLIVSGGIVYVDPGGTTNESISVNKDLTLSLGPFTVQDISVSNATLSTDTNITVDNTVVLSADGKIETINTGTLVLSASASNIIETTTAYVQGTIVAEARPIGTGTFSLLGVSNAGGNDLGNVTITRTTGTNGIVTGITLDESIACTWTLTSDNTPISQVLTFNWFSNWDNGVTTHAIFNDSGGSWNLLHDPAESITDPRVIATLNVTTFGDFTIADNGANLPVELTYFKAISQLDHILLQWQTASEINHNYFEIQRSKDGETFESLDRMSSHHNSTSLNDYEWKDLNALSGKSYYRLKIVDFDGYTEYSSIVSATSSKPLVVHPNPTSKVLNIQSDIEATRATVYHTSGKKIDLAVVDQQINVSSLLPGIYMVKMISNNEVIQARFIKK